MKRKVRQPGLVIGFALVGIFLGWIVAVSQQNQLQDPEIIRFWVENNLAVPEPIPTVHCCIGFALLFAGMPVGFLLTQKVLGRWLSPTAPKWLFFCFGFPIYTVLGAAAALPFVVWNLILLIKNRKRTGKEMREDRRVS